MNANRYIDEGEIFVMGMRQHYIPQFYLKNFSDFDQKQVGLFRIKEQKLIKHASIKDIAYRNNFYDDDNSVEDVLSNAEGSWKKTLDIFLGRNISADTLNWVVEKKEEIAYDIFRFFAITQARTAQSGDSQVEILRTIEKRVGREMSSETRDQYFGIIPEIEKHPSNMSMKIGLESIPYYAGLDLLVLYNYSNIKFITSDVPILDINPFYEKRLYHCNFGLVSMGLLKFIPISGQVCLCLFDRNVYHKSCLESMYIVDSGHVIHKINQLAVQNAYEQIFFSISSNEEYIKILCRQRKSADSRCRVRFFGGEKPELIQSYVENIHSLFLPPCLRIKKSSMRIPLPTHAGGLVRPEVQPIYDKLMTEMASHVQR